VMMLEPDGVGIPRGMVNFMVPSSYRIMIIDSVCIYPFVNTYIKSQCDNLRTGTSISGAFSWGMNFQSIDSGRQFLRLPRSS
jgi:hypothetical protein